MLTCSRTTKSGLLHPRPRPAAVSSSTDYWAEVDNAILKARAHLIHSRDKLENANFLVHFLSEMLERCREEAREKPEGSGMPNVTEEMEVVDEGNEPVFESMILFGGDHHLLNAAHLGRKRSIQLSTANSILPMERKRSAAMSLKKRSMVAPAPLQGMTIVEGKATRAMGESRPSVYFLGSRRGTSCSAASVRVAPHSDWDEQDPIFLRCLPHLAIISAAALWLLLGALIFRLLDPKIQAKPFHRPSSMPSSCAPALDGAIPTQAILGANPFVYSGENDRRLERMIGKTHFGDRPNTF